MNNNNNNSFGRNGVAIHPSMNVNFFDQEMANMGAYFSKNNGVSMGGHGMVPSMGNALPNRTASYDDRIAFLESSLMLLQEQTARNQEVLLAQRALLLDFSEAKAANDLVVTSLFSALHGTLRAGESMAPAGSQWDSARLAALQALERGSYAVAPATGRTSAALGSVILALDSLKDTGLAGSGFGGVPGSSLFPSCQRLVEGGDKKSNSQAMGLLNANPSANPSATAGTLTDVPLITLPTAGPGLPVMQLSASGG